MKRAFQIISFILLAQLSINSIATAQMQLTEQDILNTQEKGIAELEQYMEGYLLDNYANYGISGDFAHLLKIEDYRKYLRKVSQIKRVDSKTILLTTSDTEIKVTIDKGRISIRNPFSCAPCEKLSNAPIETKYWIADNLKEEDKNITVSVYTKSNILLGKFTYDFNKDVNYGLFTPKFASKETKLYTESEYHYPYVAEFHYFDKEGSEKIIDINNNIISNIDYNKPMTVVAHDFWGKKANIRQYTLCASCGSYEYEAYIRNDDQQFSAQAIKMLKHYQSVEIKDILCQGRNGEPCRAMSFYITID